MVCWVSGAVLGSLLLAMTLSSLFLSSSMHNYPGGEALDRLLTQHVGAHLLEPGSSRKPVFVHIAVPAAMTGVTRYITTAHIEMNFTRLG
jgi:hypothetical protein